MRWRSELRAEMILPRGEVGPVDFWALAWLAARLRSEISIRRDYRGWAQGFFG